MMANPSCNCPQIIDSDWHMKDLNWSGKVLYFEDVRHLFGIPLGIENKKEILFSDIARKGYTAKNPAMILHSKGLFNGRIYTEIEEPEQYDANIINLEDARILTRVYVGAAGGIKNAEEELKAFTQDRAHVLPRVIYLWIVNCPKCTPKPGSVKVVLLAQI